MVMCFRFMVFENLCMRFLKNIGLLRCVIVLMRLLRFFVVLCLFDELCMLVSIVVGLVSGKEMSWMCVGKVWLLVFLSR